MPPVVGSTADPELARRLALSAPTYQGITGLIGALHVDMERAGVPTISLRVGVPHYLGHMEHPLAVAAIVQHLAHVLGLPLTIDVQEAADRWAAQHDEAVSDDDQLRAYVRMLEIEYDRRAEAALRRADDIAAQFEDFLREQRDDPSDLSHALAAANPLSRSARMSSIDSSPTLRRTRPGSTSDASCSSGVSWLCVVLAGWITRLRTSPMLATWLCSSSASTNFLPASRPPSIWNASTEP